MFLDYFRIIETSVIGRRDKITQHFHSVTRSINHNDVTCVPPFRVGFGSAARYHSRNIDKSDSVMINGVEEGAKETVTARQSYKCPPSTVRPFAEGATYSRCGLTLPDSLSTCPYPRCKKLTAGETGRVDFHVRMQIRIWKHQYQPRPDRGSDVYCVTFDSQWKMPSPASIPRKRVAMNHCEQSIIRHRHFRQHEGLAESRDSREQRLLCNIQKRAEVE